MKKKPFPPPIPQPALFEFPEEPAPYILPPNDVLDALRKPGKYRRQRKEEPSPAATAADQDPERFKAPPLEAHRAFAKLANQKYLEPGRSLPKSSSGSSSKKPLHRNLVRRLLIPNLPDDHVPILAEETEIVSITQLHSSGKRLDPVALFKQQNKEETKQKPFTEQLAGYLHQGIELSFLVSVPILNKVEEGQKSALNRAYPDTIHLQGDETVKVVVKKAVKDAEGNVLYHESEGDEVEAVLSFDVNVAFWGDENGLYALTPGNIAFMRSFDPAQDAPDLTQEEARAHWQEFIDALNLRNEQAGFARPVLHSAAEAFQAVLPPRVRKQSAPPKPLPAYPLFASDNVHGAAVRAFAAAANWQELPGDDMAYGWSREFDNLKITIGLPNSSDAETLWEFLHKGGPRMVKAHYALWGRWYESGGGDCRQFVTVDVNQFCSDLNYSRHHHGGYEPKNKHEAIRVLEALTAVEMRATWLAPGEEWGKAKVRRLRGPLWSRGLLAEEKDLYGDLFGLMREGDSKLWEPLAFSYAPGQWFTSSEWRSYNTAVGKIGSGLMRLDNRYDEWALLIGGYLGTQVRVNKYRMQPLKVETILRETDRAQTKDARRRASEVEAKFERAMDRLQAVDVISSWTWAGGDDGEVADIDDPEAITDYYMRNPLPPFWDRLVYVALPSMLDADHHRLRHQQQKQIAAGKQRRSSSKGAAAKKGT